MPTVTRSLISEDSNSANRAIEAFLVAAIDRRLAVASPCFEPPSIQRDATAVVC
jgi:hypothetical protein